LITKPEQHNIDRAGKRLLRKALEETLGWVVNDVQEDYGIDSYVQVFEGKSPSGSWFHVQLKSSAAPDYSSDGTFISQELSIDHARHYAVEMREPVFLVHADVKSEAICWYSIQLDRDLRVALAAPKGKSITVRIPSAQRLPITAADLVSSLEKVISYWG
jgi:hypothetical protein